MATKLRREKDFVNRTVSNYLSATTSKYAKYMEGGPTFITYYQLDDVASQQDKELETVHSLVGGNTPNKYRKINDTVVYGINALDIVNEINERGLVSTINGEFIVIPDSIIPHQNDFFTFDYDGLQNHLFRVSDVQYDKASPGKYYRVQFEIFQDNSELILGNVEDEYNLIYENIGTDEQSVVLSTDSASAELSHSFSDTILNKFAELFYDEETNSYICAGPDGKSLWSPYLHHFIVKNNLTEAFSKEFMLEVYLQDCNESSLPKFYKESVYQESLFRNVELQDADVQLKHGFVEITPVDLKSTRNLPYFASERDFLALSPIKSFTDDGDLLDFTNSFMICFENGKKLFKDVPHDKKVHKFDKLHLSRIEGLLKDGDFIYECNRNELEVTGAYKKNGKEYENIGFDYIVKNGKKTGNLLADIVIEYLNGTLVIDETKITELNNYRYKNTFVDYYLMPIVIYILKNK